MLSRVTSSGRAYIFNGAYHEEVATYLCVLLQERRLTLGKCLIWGYTNTLGPTLTYGYKQAHREVWYLYGPDAPPLDAPLLTE